MIRIKKSVDTNFVYIDKVSSGISEEFEYIKDGEYFSINRKNTSILEVHKLHYSKFIGEGIGGGDIFFNSDTDLENYFNEVFTYTDKQFFPKPIVVSLDKQTFSHNATTNVVLNGSYFTLGTTVIVNQQSVNNVTINNGGELVFELTTNDIDGSYDLIIENESGQTIVSNAITVLLSQWIDLRLGGDDFVVGQDLRLRSGMNMNRDSSGMYFDGASPWVSWVKFESLSWNRGEGRSLEWIFTAPTAHMMIGIGSDQTNETNNAQYSQAEVQAYFTSSTNFWGLYGNNGNVGSAGNNSNSANFGSNSTLKIKFEDDGGKGSLFSIYELPNSDASSWDDESNLLKQFNIGGTLNPSQSKLMPFIISRANSSQRFIAIK